jgi:S-adenosylmethionine decarboxylase
LNNFERYQAMEALGRHVIIEYYGCPIEKLNGHDAIEEVMVGAAKAMRATLVSVHFHQFNPHGVSGAIVISESHLTIHTWPEFGYAAIDVFTCGDVIDPWQAHRHMREYFQPQRESIMELKRGCMDVPEGTLPTSYSIKPKGEE